MNIDSDIVNINTENIYDLINSYNKISQPILTKYEKTKIIGISAQQIESGRKPNIDIPKSITTPLQIALYELQKKQTPFIVKRKLPNNQFEYWSLDQLEIV